MRTYTICNLFAVLVTTIAIEASAARVVAQAAPCTLSQRQYNFSVRDLPNKHSDFSACLETRMEPTRGELVQCRVFWQLLAASDTGVLPRCSDYPYLEPANHGSFPDELGEVCRVRQVTQAQASRGEPGWYYKDSAPARCRNQGAAAVFPLDHPERFEVLLECGIIKALDGDSVVNVAANACVAPPEAASATDVGQVCSRELLLSELGFSVGIGSEQCATGVCLTTPLDKLNCSEHNGIGYCSSTTSRCSCRCAGERDDDSGPFCACPDEYECKPVLEGFAASPETRGSYCVPTDQRSVPRD